MSKKIRTTEFSRLLKEIKEIQKRYLLTIASHRIFNELWRSNKINLVGKKKANNNVDVMKKYKYFFTTILEASKCFTLIEVYKFFDSSESRTIYWILDYAEKNIDRLGKNNFSEYHKNRDIISLLFDDYKELEIGEIKRFKRRLKNNEARIERLKDYRDKNLAHDDFSKKETKISLKDIQVLLKIVKDIIDFFFYKLDFSSTDYKNYEDVPIEDVKRLFKDLYQSESLRLEEIKRKYKL